MKILFVTWDGYAQNYIDGLFAPIFEELKKLGFEFHILQFTTGGKNTQALAKQFCDKAGIKYTVHKVFNIGFLGKILTLLVGTFLIKKYLLKHQIRYLMPRSIIPCSMCMFALNANKDIRLIFDTDGLVADDRIDFSEMSPLSLTYRLLRDIENLGLNRATTVLTRTHASLPILYSRAGASSPPSKFFVVPNGKNENLFRPASQDERESLRTRFGWNSDTIVVIHVGSLGPAYYPDKIFSFFKTLLKYEPNSFLQILTGNLDVAEQALGDSQVPLDKIDIRRVAHDQVPLYIAASDLGIAFRQPLFSLQAAAPIKIAEYLLCGVPIITTYGVGDVNEQLSGSESVHFLESPTTSAFLDAIDWLLKTVRPNFKTIQNSCREIGLRHFSMGKCISAYRSALEFTMTESQYSDY